MGRSGDITEANDEGVGLAPRGGAGRVALGVALLLLVVLGCVLGYRQIGSPDFGFHLVAGRWMVENGRVPTKDIFTYTVTENRYVDLNWAPQLLWYALHEATGPASITYLTTLMTLGFGGLLLWRARRREGRVPIAALPLLLVFFLGNNWEVRPHLFSWVLGALVFLVLEEYQRGSRRGLFMLPILMAIWVNCHSLFILGLIAIATYVFAAVVMGFVRHRRWHVDKWLLIWSGAALVACLLNPYHVKGLVFPLQQFLLIQGEGGYKSTLTGTAEFKSPFRMADYIYAGRLVLFQPLLWWQVFTVLAIAGLVGAWRRARLAEIMVFGGFLFIFSSANKNFGYFVMAAFPVAAGGLDRLGAGLRALASRGATSGEVAPTVPAGSRAPLAGLVVFALLCALLVPATWSGWVYDLGWSRDRPGTGYNADLLPVGASAFIAEHGLEGRLLNTWNDGGYLGWALDRPVFINSEGNTIGEAFYAEYVEARGPKGFARALERWEPQVVVARFSSTEYWLFHLDRAADWRMVYADLRTAVFARGSAATDVPTVPDAEAGEAYPVYEPERAAALIKAALARGPRGFGAWWRGSAAYPLRETARAKFLLQTGQVDACINTCVAGLERTPFFVPELVLVLGHAFNADRQYAWADACFDAFLRHEDDPAVVGQINAARRARR